MPALDSPAELVARFLRTNDYSETLSAFLEEAGLPVDAGSNHPGALTIEKIVQEKSNFDLTVNFEKLGVEDKLKQWTLPAPCVPTKLDMPSAANILCTSVESLSLADEKGRVPLILAATADRRLNIIRPGLQNFDLVQSHTQLQDSPILSYTIVAEKYVVCSSMSGKIVIFDSEKNEVIAQRKDHSKYVVQVSSHEDEHGRVFLATAGWDAKVLIYLIRLSSSDNVMLGDPIGSIELPTNPEALLFVRHPDNHTLNLLLTRRDSSSLFYYQISADIAESTFVSLPVTISLSGKQNLAPYSNAWVAFTPAAIALSPIDPTLLAVATSTVPHMKLLIVRLLFPLEEDPEGEQGLPLPRVPPTSLLGGDNALTPAARLGRIALALQDREAAAISIQCNTFAQQTQYSSPALAWRPDGSGIYVNSDDGVVRGIECTTGKVVQSLVGHVIGSKIRCLWAGHVDVGADDGRPEEWALSGGFDQQLFVWRVDS